MAEQREHKIIVTCQTLGCEFAFAHCLLSEGSIKESVEELKEAMHTQANFAILAPQDQCPECGAKLYPVVTLRLDEAEKVLVEVVRD